MDRSLWFCTNVHVRQHGYPFSLTREKGAEHRPGVLQQHYIHSTSLTWNHPPSLLAWRCNKLMSICIKTDLLIYFSTHHPQGWCSPSPGAEPPEGPETITPTLPVPWTLNLLFWYFRCDLEWIMDLHALLHHSASGRSYLDRSYQVLS